MDCQLNKRGLMDQYIVLSSIGQGAFGSVRLGYHGITGTLVAIKIIKNLEENHRFILSEMAALEKLHHPNIIRLFQVLVTPEYVCLITEFAPGRDLLQKVIKEGRLQEEEAQKIFGQILSAIRCCHDLDIVHRDLKPENILLDEEGNAKLADFGLSTRCRAGTVLKKRCGTKTYNAPELVLGKGYDGKKADVWSLGVLLYFITTGYHPFRGRTQEEIERKIHTGNYAIPAHVSGQLENLIHQMLSVVPENRPSIEDLQQHPWVRRFEENSSKETYIDPKVLDILSDRGFKMNDVLESLHKKRYDEVMGTYLIIKEQVRKGVQLDFGYTTSVKPVDHGVAPPVSPVHPSTSPLQLKRRASEPTFGLFHTQMPVVPTAPGQKLTRSASMPLGCPQKSPTFRSASPSTAETSSSVCSNIAEEEMPQSPEHDSNIEKAPPPQNIGCVQRLCKRFRACIARLCCFSGDQNTQAQPMYNNKVAPLKESGCRAQ